MEDKIIGFVNKLNETSFLENVKVPIFDGFKVIPNEGTLFTAVSDDGYIEQFMTDGILIEGDTFLKHVDKVIKDTKKMMKESGIVDVEESFIFCKDFSTNKYDFKIYIQDNVLDKNIIRQFNIYFIDKTTNAFYEITFSSCPFLLQDIDYVNDVVTSNMLTTINNMLDYIQ